MKISKINIYGYGKWINESWNIKSNGIQLFVGNNESGKSTFMSFILAILFGFPKKGSNQYIPKGKTEYGGSITFESSTAGKVVIERVKGRRAKGEVTIYYSDGTLAGEEGLAELLQEIDRNSFRGIFHFDLDGLNGLGTMNPEQLNQFLYDTGIGGGNSITELEKKLDLEATKLFKPRGKTTEMNFLAKQLQEKDQQIQKWEERLDQYDRFTNSINELEEDLRNNKQEQEQLIKKMKQVATHEMVEKIARQWEEKKLQLSKERDIAFFPENGIRRLDTYLEKLLEKQVQLKDEQIRQSTLEKELESLHLHSNWLDVKQEIADLLQKYEVYQNRQLEIDNYKLEIDQLNKKKMKLENNWQVEAPVDFSEVPYHSFMKATFSKLKDQWNSSEQIVKKLEAEVDELERDLNHREKELDVFEKELLSSEEVHKLSKVINTQNSGSKKIERDLLSNQLKDVQEEKNDSVRREKNQQHFLIGLVSVMVTLTLISLFTFDFYIQVILGTLTVLFIGSYFWKRTFLTSIAKKYDGRITTIHSKLQELNQELTTHEVGDVARWEELLKKDQNLRTTYEQRMYEKKALLSRRNNLLQDKDKYVQLLNTIQLELDRWCQQYKLPNGLDFLFYENVLVSIEEWNRFFELEEVIREKQAILNGHQEEYIAKLRNLFQQLSLSPAEEDQSTSQQIDRLKKFHERELGKEIERYKLIERLKHRETVISRLQLEIEEINGRINELFEKAEVSNEEAFRQQAESYDRQRKLEAEKLQNWIQMKHLLSGDEAKLKEILDQIIYSGYEPKEVQQQLAYRKEELEQVNDNIRERISEVKKEMAVLEEDGTYEELRLQFTHMQEELQSLLKKWATASVSKLIIDEVKSIYEQERQPVVLLKAQELFSKMTSGEYLKLYAPLGEERFIVERADGIRFEPFELSRGTCELLYLSLRFALATTYPNQQESFPIIMDETLVNMDRSRRRNIVHVLKDLSTTHQILIFTCHEHIREEFQDGEIFLKST